MLLRNVLAVNLGLLALLAISCEKKDNDKEPAAQVESTNSKPRDSSGGQAPENTVDKPTEDKSAALLLGLWTSCEKMDIPASLGETYPVRGQMISFNFQSKDKAEIKSQYMKDAECKEPLTEAHVQQYRDDVFKECLAESANEAVCNAAADESVADLASDFLKTDVTAATYIASAPAASGRGTLDITSADDPSKPDVFTTFYTSYELSGNVLKYAGVCEKGDVEEGICSKVNVGDSPEDRVVIFDNSVTLTKK